MTSEAAISPPTEHAPEPGPGRPMRHWLGSDILGVNRAVFLFLALSLALAYVARLRWSGDMYSPDSRYYLVMTLRDLREPVHQALADQYQLTGFTAEPWYFSHQDPTWLMVQSRMLYPFLSAPFVWLFGPYYGMVVVPILALAGGVLAVARTAQRLYGPLAALAAAELMAVCPFLTDLVAALTDALAVGIVALILLNLPLGRRAGGHNLVALALLSVMMCFTRQSMPAAAGMVFGGWLWAWLFPGGGRPRRLRNEWTAPAVVVMGTTTVLQAILSLIAGTHVGGGATTPLPVVGWNIAWEDFHELARGDRFTLLLVLAATLAVLLRFTDVVTGVFLGTAAGTFVIIALGSTPSGMRYEAVLFPVAALGSASFVDAVSPGGTRRRTNGVLQVGTTWWQEDARRIPALAASCVLGVAGMIGWSARHGSASVVNVVPTSPAAAAAGVGTGFDRTPAEHRDGAQILKEGLVAAATMKNTTDSNLWYYFDWRHTTRYRPTGPADPGWASRDSEGTVVVYYGDFSSQQFVDFAGAVSLEGTVDADSLKILARSQSAYGEDLTFTIADQKHMVHRGRATVLYPLHPGLPGTITELVYDS